jgi:hypothetical protein
MKKSFLILLVLLYFKSYSQVTNRVPINDEGKVFYSEVISLENTSKEIIYNNVKLFFADSFKSSNNVIQVDDKEAGIVLGKGNTNISIRSGKHTFKAKVDFTLKVSIKENKVKIDMYNIIYNGNTEAEVNFNTESDRRYNDPKTKDYARIIMDDYIDGTNNIFNELKSKLLQTFNSEDDW